MSHCNSTLDHQLISEKAIWHGMTTHEFGLVFCAVFGGISVLIGFYLIMMHATHYLKPWEQKHIIRILLMIPVYSFVSFLSYVFYTKAIYFEVIRDCYEAFAIAAFFTLLCNYIAPNLHDQKEFFRTLIPKNWFWEFFWLQRLTGGQDKGPLRRPKSGLTWFNVIWLSIFQYCFVRVLFTLVSCLSEFFNRYCEDSLNPAFAHIWVEAFESVSVLIAMTCVIQFYIQLKDDLAEHRPFLKVACIKLVIFLSFWQELLLSMLSSSSGPLKPSDKIAYADIKVGIPSMLLCAEMAIFAVLHVFAFPWKPYSKKHNKLMDDPINAPGLGYSGAEPEYQGGFLGWKALLDAFNPWDIIKAIGRSFRWLFVGRKHRKNDSSYEYAARVASQEQNGGSSSKLNDDVAQQQSYAPPTTNFSDPDSKQAPPYSDGAADFELRPTNTHNSDDYGDHTGLLSHAQADPSSSYPPRDLGPLHDANPYSTSEPPYPPPPSSNYPSHPPAHPLAGAMRTDSVGLERPGMAITTQPQTHLGGSGVQNLPPPQQQQARGEDWDIWNGAAGAGLESPEEWHHGRGAGSAR
ncbi:DUF300-domain-containing protein [Viridothelium virens]|uniref:DUF300-domain-containing protein n=1 Tax=Viridothelium virens TaxID=1048519 RepID=A0A6A6HCL9_VIRVR|nr:DUF300-domain-containing protein [Viridothelium virens]